MGAGALYTVEQGEKLASGARATCLIGLQSERNWWANGARLPWLGRLLEAKCGISDASFTLHERWASGSAVGKRPCAIWVCQVVVGVCICLAKAASMSNYWDKYKHKYKFRIDIEESSKD